MAYFFPSIQREVFQKTFLKDVCVSFLFREVSSECVVFDEIRSFYREHFHLEDVKEDQILDGLLVTSDDKLIRFEFTLKYVVVKMKFPAYKSFSYAERWILVMQKYMNLLHVDQVEKIILWKYNELRYNFADDSANVSLAMEQIFSSELLNYDSGDGKSFVESSKNFNGLSRWEKKHVFSDSKGSKSILTVEYGFCEQPDKMNEGVLTMKTYIESIDNILDVARIAENSKMYNDILDSAFYWCINENIINEMRNK